MSGILAVLLSLLPSPFFSNKIKLLLEDDDDHYYPHLPTNDLLMSQPLKSYSLTPMTSSSASSAFGLQALREMDDLSVERVVEVLRSNARQWSFVESQLMEPNVNLAMPEIAIPLRHLSTTLELLGNILFLREDNLAALEHLVRTLY